MLLRVTHTHTHTHMHNRFTAVWILSRTTRLSRKPKNHSSTHTYRGYQSSLICFIHLLRSMASSVQFMCLTVFFHHLSPSFLWFTSWPGTFHFILHTFLHPIIFFFHSTCRYHRNLFWCSTEIMSSNPNLSISTLYLELYLVVSCHTST